MAPRRFSKTRDCDAGFRETRDFDWAQSWWRSCRVTGPAIARGLHRYPDHGCFIRPRNRKPRPDAPKRRLLAQHTVGSREEELSGYNTQVCRTHSPRLAGARFHPKCIRKLCQRSASSRLLQNDDGSLRCRRTRPIPAYQHVSWPEPDPAADCVGGAADGRPALAVGSGSGRMSALGQKQSFVLGLALGNSFALGTRCTGCTQIGTVISSLN